MASRLEQAQIANAQVNDMAGLWAHPQLAARQRWREVDLLCENEQVMKHTTREQLAAMCDPVNYPGAERGDGGPGAGVDAGVKLMTPPASGLCSRRSSAHSRRAHRAPPASRPPYQPANLQPALRRRCESGNNVRARLVGLDTPSTQTPRSSAGKMQRHEIERKLL